jgi:CubicO group peptidase (beta-lactamase class C family)
MTVWRRPGPGRRRPERAKQGPGRHGRRAVAAFVVGAILAAACSDPPSEVEVRSAADPTIATTTPEPTTTESPTDRGSSTTVRAPVTSSEPTRDFSAIGPIVDAVVAAEGLEGAGLVVVERDDGVVHEQYWGEFGPERISLVASTSKMIAAAVLAALSDDGLLDLDAPVADVVEWGSGNPDVTPAQLVSNSSGLVGLGPNLAYPPYLCQFLTRGTLQGCASAVFTTSADDADVVAPDTEFRYGGAQWQVAGAVAEAASGRSWAELVEQTFAEPCGLESLGFNNHWTQLGLDFDYPDAFGADPSSLRPTDNPNIEGGAYMTAPDAGQFVLMLLRYGRCGAEQVLSPAAVERMLADRIGEVYGGSDPRSNGVLGYGMGWFVDRTTGVRTDPGAYGTVAWLDPAAGHGAYLVIEGGGDVGTALATALQAPIAAAVADS